MRVEPITICVIIPTYNNKLTIEAVISNVCKVMHDVIVVDDGSTDGSSQLLDRISGISVVRHERNQGKGAALADGFAFAAPKGYSHAISMDGDGQHLAADLSKFVKEIEHEPSGMIIGRRNLAGSGKRFKSRILRAHSNFWVWLLTGIWIRDSQAGFRAYPLKGVTELRVKTRRYDYEVEILVKCLWAGMPVREIPVEVDYVHWSGMPPISRKTTLSMTGLLSCYSRSDLYSRPEPCGVFAPGRGSHDRFNWSTRDRRIISVDP